MTRRETQRVIEAAHAYTHTDTERPRPGLDQVGVTGSRRKEAHKRQQQQQQ